MAAAKQQTNDKPQDDKNPTPSGGDDKPALNAQSKAEEAAELKAQLAEAQAENEQLKADNEQLKAKLEQAMSEVTNSRAKLDSTLGDLGEDAFELRDSITVLDRDRVRISPRKGDVVTTKSSTKELEKKVGAKARIFCVSKETVDELRKTKFLRG